MWNSILLWFQLHIPFSFKKSKILYLFNVRLSHITLLLTFMLNPMVVWVLFIICLCQVLNMEDFPIQQLKLLLWWLLSVGPREIFYAPGTLPHLLFTLPEELSWWPTPMHCYLTSENTSCTFTDGLTSAWALIRIGALCCSTVRGSLVAF